MSFSYTLPKLKLTPENLAKGEKILFSYCYPYTYSKLINFLKSLHVECRPRDCLKETILCKSLSGLTVPLLTITSRIHTDPKSYNQIKLEEFDDANSRISLPLSKKKRYAVISARIHPGETPGSYMMQGFLKYLCSDAHQAV